MVEVTSKLQPLSVSSLFRRPLICVTQNPLHLGKAAFPNPLASPCTHHPSTSHSGRSAGSAPFFPHAPPSVVQSFAGLP